MKTIKKLVTCFAFLALTMTTVFSVGSAVAKVGNTEYPTFADALDAWSDGTTLTLLSDVTVDSTIEVGYGNNNRGSYTLDLNNHGIIFSGDIGSVLFIGEYKALTMNDSAPTKTDHYIMLEDSRGVNVSDTGTESSTCVKVTGGYITGGNAHQGGGVEVDYGAIGFTMNAGTIVGNKAQYGGGIDIDWTSATITGNSKIIKNTATGSGGGICTSNGSVLVADGVQITGNIKHTDTGDIANNVYLGVNDHSPRIDFFEELNENARIGVTVDQRHDRVITRGLCGNTNWASGSVSNFISDDPAYTVVLNSDGEAALVPCARVTANDDPNNTGTYYATFYDSTTKYVADANTEVYYATANENGKLMLTKVENKIIKAGEGVILKSTSASIVLAETSENASYDSILTGSDTATTLMNALVLSDGESGVGFYKYTGSVAAHKAYISE